MTIRDSFGSLVFPAGKVETRLRECLAAGAVEQFALGMINDPLRPTIDSLFVVEILVSLEDITSCELPESVVRKGGYRSIEEAVQDLLPKIERRWQEYYRRAG